MKAVLVITMLCFPRTEMLVVQDVFELTWSLDYFTVHAESRIWLSYVDRVDDVLYYTVLEPGTDYQGRKPEELRLGKWGSEEYWVLRKSLDPELLDVARLMKHGEPLIKRVAKIKQ